MNTYIVDVDGTICVCDESISYADRVPIWEMIDKLNHLFETGHKVVYYTARGMRTFEGSVPKIRKYVLPTLIEWMDKHNVKRDDVLIGKPWGENVYYIDDRALTPTMFLYDH